MARLAALLGARSGNPQPLERGLTPPPFKGPPRREHLLRWAGLGAGPGLLGKNKEPRAHPPQGPAGASPRGPLLPAPPCRRVTLYIEGEAPTAAELSGSLLPEAARTLRRLHTSGKQWDTPFDPYATVERYGELARASGTEVSGFKQALKQARAIGKAVARHPEHRPAPCHNDLLTDNFFKSPDGLMLADWEYAGMGDPFFDLGSFSANNGLPAERRGAAARRVLRRAAHAPPPRRPAADALHVGLP